MSSVAFSPDGNYLVSSEENIVRLREASTGKEIAHMTHDGSVTSVAFSPDSKYIVSGSADTSVRVWDVATGKEIARRYHDDLVTIVAFSPNGKYVVSGSDDGSAYMWFWNHEELITQACSRVTRNLTSTEWKHYIGDALPYPTKQEDATCPNLPLEPEP